MVTGSGGREHAIAWKLAQSELVDEVVCVPGNGGTAFEKKCRNVNPEDFCDRAFSEAKGVSLLTAASVRIAKSERVDLAVIGPEDPLAEGIADFLREEGIPTAGASAKAARLEADKDFAKSFMKKYGVACADSETFSSKDEAIEEARKRFSLSDEPLVIKASGLAAGKGVIIVKSMEEAQSAIASLMDGSLGEAGRRVLIEDYLRGRELSVLAAVSTTEDLLGRPLACVMPFLPARDHKRLLEGGEGPNTGGMGAICPTGDETAEFLKDFSMNVYKPTIKGIEEEGLDYRGFIFFGLMLTSSGVKVLEYNARLGDPETQAVLPLMESDFALLCQRIAEGHLNGFRLTWKQGFQVAPVAVSKGYPGSYEKGKPISIAFDEVEKNFGKVFIAGAQAAPSSTSKKPLLMTSGGRVLCCSCFSATLDEAREKAYSALNSIHFEGMQFRGDIGEPGAAESK